MKPLFGHPVSKYRLRPCYTDANTGEYLGFGDTHLKFKILNFLLRNNPFSLAFLKTNVVDLLLWIQSLIEDIHRNPGSAPATY